MTRARSLHTLKVLTPDKRVVTASLGCGTLQTTKEYYTALNALVCSQVAQARQLWSVRNRPDLGTADLSRLLDLAYLTPYDADDDVRLDVVDGVAMLPLSAPAAEAAPEVNNADRAPRPRTAQRRRQLTVRLAKWLHRCWSPRASRALSARYSRAPFRARPVSQLASARRTRAVQAEAELNRETATTVPYVTIAMFLYMLERLPIVIIVEKHAFWPTAELMNSVLVALGSVDGLREQGEDVLTEVGSHCSTVWHAAFHALWHKRSSCGFCTASTRDGASQAHV